MRRARLGAVGLAAVGWALALGCAVACSSGKSNPLLEPPPEVVPVDAGAGSDELPTPDAGGSDLGSEGEQPVPPDPGTSDAGSVLVPIVDAGDAGADAGVEPAPGDAGPPPPLDPAVQALIERFDVLSARLAPLAQRTMDFWLEHGPDTTFGGFHGTLDRQGNPIAPTDKGLIQEVRQLWTLSTWYERRERSARITALADASYEFVRESFLDTDGAFVFKVSRDGTRVVDAKKQMFAESYAIFALATYGRVFGVPEALELALARFASIDRQRHDTTNGGYDQTGDPGLITSGAARDTNTQLHLMEAFTALYQATDDAVVGARLSELIDLYADTLRQPSGYVPSEYTATWAPFGTPTVSYGHDLETAWLMLDAAALLGREGEASLRSASLAIAAHSAQRGFDATLGGYFELGVPAGAVTDRDKIWWVQFEALNGLWWAYELSGDLAYLDRLSATLDWIELAEDLPSGEWFATTNANGTALGADYKGDEWKESYHPIRALVYVQDWIAAERAALLPR
jgi:cellobiose epimerase